MAVRACATVIGVTLVKVSLASSLSVMPFFVAFAFTVVVSLSVKGAL